MQVPYCDKAWHRRQHCGIRFTLYARGWYIQCAGRGGRCNELPEEKQADLLPMLRRYGVTPSYSVVHEAINEI